jgi:hypothetical protein
VSGTGLKSFLLGQRMGNSLAVVVPERDGSGKVGSRFACESQGARRVNRRRILSDLALVEERELPAGALLINRKRA